MNGSLGNSRLAAKSRFNCLNGCKPRKLTKKEARAVLEHRASGRPNSRNPVMKSQSQAAKNGSNTAAAPQSKTSQGRAGELPRKLPVDCAERYIAKEFKIVSLRETPLPSALHLCDSPDRAAEYWRLCVATNPYFNSDCECLVVLSLNTRRRVKGHQLVTIGTMDTLLVHPREVFRGPIVASAAAIILMHNHPSGVPSPSDADIKVTRALIRAGRLLKIEVLDHIIMGRADDGCIKGYASLRELGYFYGDFDPSKLPVKSRKPKATKRVTALACRRVR